MSKQRVHLVAHSFCGVDARAALSILPGGFDDYVQSLTTVCSPHHGLKLIDKARKFPDQFGDLSQMEKAFEALGMSNRNVLEFTSDNLSAFNEVAADKHGVDYYSFGAKRKEAQINELLRAGYEVITDHEI